MRFREQQQMKLMQTAMNKEDTPLSSQPPSLHLQLLSLKQDIEKLLTINQRAERTKIKKTQLLPKWLPIAEQYLADDKVFKNEVFAWCIVWLFDVGQYDQALAWTDIAITQGQETPGNIKRDFAHFAADQIIEWAEQISPTGQSVEPYFSLVFEKIKTQWKLNEQLAAKYYKFAGLALLRSKNGKVDATKLEDIEVLTQADALLAVAEELHHKIQVKTQRNTIAARIRKLQTA